MNRICTASILVALVLCGPVAHAAPPTVTPSPGYDARLQEQHKATSTSNSAVILPVAPPVTPVPRQHRKRTH